VNVEDVETRAIIYRIRDVHLVDFQIRKWEDITGLKRHHREKEREWDEWHIRNLLLENLRMDSDIILFQKPNLENKTNNKTLYIL
jgi:hypothetical protein